MGHDCCIIIGINVIIPIILFYAVVNLMVDNGTHTIDNLLNDSRISPMGNGSSANDSTVTGGQKWWAAVLIGFIFALISSPAFYNITSNLVSPIGIKLTDGPGPTLTGLILHTIIFTIVIRIILW